VLEVVLKKENGYIEITSGKIVKTRPKNSNPLNKKSFFQFMEQEKPLFTLTKTIINKLDFYLIQQTKKNIKEKSKIISWDLFFHLRYLWVFLCLFILNLYLFDGVIIPVFSIVVPLLFCWVLIIEKYNPLLPMSE
jgi:hypothetical protein